MVLIEVERNHIFSSFSSVKAKVIAEVEKVLLDLTVVNVVAGLSGARCTLSGNYNFVENGEK